MIVPSLLPPLLNVQHIPELFRSIQTFYRSGQFCDLAITCNPLDPPVWCHSLVLGSLSPFLRTLLADETPNGANFNLYVPEISSNELKDFVDKVYEALPLQVVEITVPKGLADVFRLGSFRFVQPTAVRAPLQELPNLGEILESNLYIKSEDIIPELDEISDAVDFGPTFFEGEVSLQDEPKNNRSRKRKLEKSGELTQIEDPKNPKKKSPKNCNYRNKLGKEVFKYSTSLPHGEELSNEQFEAVIHRSEGWFQATSDRYFYEQKVKLGRTGSTSHISSFPNKKFVVMLGLSMEGSKNIATTLASTHPSWPEQKTVDNMVEIAMRYDPTCSWESVLMAKKMGKASQELKWMQERINTQLKKLTVSEDERSENIRLCYEKLSDFQATRQEKKLFHLPNAPTKLEFEVRPSIAFDDMMDFVLLSGDSYSTLKIQTYINFDYFTPQFQSATTNIMVCTMVMFLGLRSGQDLLQTSYFGSLYKKYAAIKAELNFWEEKQTKQCPQCGDIFIGKEIFIHKKKHEVENFDCGCGITFATFLEKENHLKFKHSTKSYVPCPKTGCNRTFSTSEAANRHMQRMHDRTVQGEGCVCDICAERLENPYRLKLHKDNKHTPFPCPECGKIFVGKGSFTNHFNKTHTGDWKCPDCDSVFNCQKNLSKHKRQVHTPDSQKRHQCDLCGKGFIERRKLDAHMMNVHIKTRPYKCRFPNCQADFNDLSNCRSHEKRVHGKKQTAPIEFGNVATNPHLHQSIQQSN